MSPTPSNAGDLGSQYAAALLAPGLIATVWKNNTYLLSSSSLNSHGASGVNQAYDAGTSSTGDIEEQKGAALVATAAVARRNTSVFAYAAPGVAWAFAHQDAAGSFYMGQSVAPVDIAHDSAVFLEPMGQSLVAAVASGFDPISGVSTTGTGAYAAAYKAKWISAVDWWMASCYPAYINSLTAYGEYGHRRGMISAILCQYAYLTGNEARYMPELQTFIEGGDSTRVSTASQPFAGLIYNVLPAGYMQIAASPVNGKTAPGIAYAAGSASPIGALPGAGPC